MELYFCRLFKWQTSKDFMTSMTSQRKTNYQNHNPNGRLAQKKYPCLIFQLS